jgi:dienelactone hydrolase
VAEIAGGKVIGLMLVALLGPQEAAKPEDPRKMLYKYLQAEAQKMFDARRAEVAALKTPEDVRRRQERLRAQFIEALGGFPEKTPLNPRVVGTLKRDGFSVDKVIFESRPNHHVTAVFYRPDGPGPFSGVLVPCGHSENGKAEKAYQSACISMAKNGLAVLCYDPIGQGERKQLLDPNGKAAIQGSTTEHTMAGIGALLVGNCAATYRIWDGIRAIDYMASRPEVDPSKLGCTGNSGGGTLTAYLMALDDRIVAAAPSCYITTLEKLFDTIGPQDAEQNIPGQVAFGMEHTDYVTMRAPRATLICVGTQDYFNIDGAWTTFREAKRVYGILGHAERVDLFEYNDKHGFSPPRRQASMRWMRRWLLGKDDATPEPELTLFTDAELQCTETGQVLSSLKSKSVFDLNAEAEERCSASRTGCDSAAVRRQLGLPDRVLPARIVSRRQEGTVVDIEVEPGIRVTGQDTVIGEGEFALMVDGERASTSERISTTGQRFVMIDLRGMGLTSPSKPDPKRPAPFGGDAKEAFLSLHIGRPLLGQRVYDILATIETYAAGKAQDTLLSGVGSAAPIALHAAALDPRITSLILDGGVISWSSVVKTAISRNQLTNVVPGALKHYDLPDLACLVAPRPLTIRNPVDPMGKPVTQEELEKAYAKVKAAYAAKNAADKLVLKAGP